jgi:hypothetical protein
MLEKVNGQMTPSVTEGVPRSGTTGGTAGVAAPDPEVSTAHPRRNHTAAYKIKIIETAKELRAQGHGVLGAFLRREGLYYSTVTRWERERAEGTITGKKPGPKGKSRQELVEENKALRRKLEQAENRLAKTELIVELQKKLSSILGLTSEATAETPDAP